MAPSAPQEEKNRDAAAVGDLGFVNSTNGGTRKRDLRTRGARVPPLVLQAVGDLGFVNSTNGGTRKRDLRTRGARFLPLALQVRLGRVEILARVVVRRERRHDDRRGHLRGRRQVSPVSLLTRLSRFASKPRALVIRGFLTRRRRYLNDVAGAVLFREQVERLHPFGRGHASGTQKCCRIATACVKLWPGTFPGKEAFLNSPGSIFR